MFTIPDEVRPLRDRVRSFVEDRVYPYEGLLSRGGDEAREILERLSEQAKSEGLWALGHPKDIGGGGLSFFEYVFVNEVIGRCWTAQLALGTETLQTAMLLHKHASDEWRETILLPLVAGSMRVCFAVTEPAVASSDPTGLQTRADLDGDEWVINGRKWFTSGADRGRYTIAMVRTEPPETPAHKAFSMIIVPNDTPGYTVVRDVRVLGLTDLTSGHFEVTYDDVRVPAANLLGGRGEGFVLAQDRLGPGRIYHCMRWLGMAQRALEMLAARANSRMLGGEPLASKQLIQQMVFDSYCEIQAARLMTLDAARLIDEGDQARVEVSAIKVLCARTAHDVIDRAMQVHGAAGVGDDTPLEFMYRVARFGRIVDGPDEAHVARVGRYLLRRFAEGGAGWDFAAR